MSENYFKILEVGKNVGKFFSRRSKKWSKMSENYLPKVNLCQKMSDILIYMYLHNGNFLTFLRIGPFSDTFLLPKQKI